MLSCVICVVQHVSWLMNVHVLGVLKWLTTTEKVKCRVHARWTDCGEGHMRRLEPRNHMLQAIHTSTWVMKVASLKSRRKAKASSL
jgi:hypothetical protein